MSTTWSTATARWWTLGTTRKNFPEIVLRPTVAVVEAGCERFRQTDQETDAAVGLAFRTFPNHTSGAEVLLKVAALNSLFSTSLLGIRSAAAYITSNGTQLDEWLRIGDAQAVELLRNVKVSETGSHRDFYSFATKYCAMHAPDKFVIYDSRVEKYLWALHARYPLKSLVDWRNHPMAGECLRSYSTLVASVREFRQRLGLEKFSFCELDQFFYVTGDDEFVSGFKQD